MNRINSVRNYCEKNNISVAKYIVVFIKDKFNSLIEKIRVKMRLIFIDNPNRKRLLNKGASIVSINCNGGTISHDLGLRFNSQFVNLWLYPKDFIKYCSNFDYYNEQPLSFIKEEGIDYPIGLVDDIRIYFMHYLSERHAREKWEQRKQRIDKNNLFFMMTDQENCTIEDMRNFDNLPFKNKVIFTHLPMNNIKSSFYINGFENQSSVGKLNGWAGKCSIKKYYDQFDYVSWLNNGI